MIKSFGDEATRLVFERKRVRCLHGDLQRRALRKLLVIDAAEDLRDLKMPQGNRLEALKGNRRGQHSIPINDRWRVCFRWSSGNAYDLEIVDYH